MNPLPKDQVQQTAQILLAYLSDDKNSTPNNMLEGVVSGKSILRGILQGNLVVCAVGEADPPVAPPLVEAPEEGVDNDGDKTAPTELG